MEHPTLVLGGSSAYTGATNVTGGSITFSNLGAFNNGSGITLSNSASLIYTGNGGTLSVPLTSGSGSSDSIINSGGGILTLTGTLTKTDSVLSLSGGTFIVNWQITGGDTNSFNSDFVAGPHASVTVDGSNNNYTGTTWIVGSGTLLNGTNNALPAGTVVETGTGTDTPSMTNVYNLNGFNQTVAALISSGSATQIVTNTGTSTLTLTGTNGDNAIVNGMFGGTIQDGSSQTSLAVTGGTQTLTGTSTYTGATTVSGGALQVNGKLSGNGAVAVNGGTLGGSGKVTGAVTVSAGGSTYPSLGGAASAQTTLQSNLTYNATSSAQFQVVHAITPGSSAAPAATGNYDQIALTGASAVLQIGTGNAASQLAATGNGTSNSGVTLQLNMSGGTFSSLQSNAAGANGNPLYVGANTGSNVNLGQANYFVLTLGTGTSLGLFETLTVDEGGNTLTGTILYSGGSDRFGGTVSDGTIGDVIVQNIGDTITQEFAISYVGNSANGDTVGGHDIVLTAIPEPETWAMLAAGAGLLFAFRRRRRKA